MLYYTVAVTAGMIALITALFHMCACKKKMKADLVEKDRRYKKQADYLDTLIESMNEFFFTYDGQGILTFVNKKCLEVLAYRPDEMVGRPVLDFIAEYEREKIGSGIAARLRSGEKKSYETVALHKNGDMHLIRLNTSPIYADGKIAGGMVLAEDITGQKAAEEKLNRQQVYFRQLFENSPEGIAMLDNHDIILDANKGFENLFQYPIHEIRGRHINDLIVPESLVDEANRISDSVNHGQVMQKETVRRSRDGRRIHVSILGYPIMYNGVQTGVFGIYSDITGRKISEEQLRYLSLHDSLTGVFNRTYFEQEMQRIAKEGYTALCMIVCDVDGLKLINDTMGHDHGDLLLISAANALRKAFDDTDLVARIGGDEFAVITNTNNEKTIRHHMQKLRDIVTAYNADDTGIPLSISTGSAGGELSSRSVIDLFKEADNNMYREKLNHTQSARNSIVQTLIKTLEARDFLSEGHAERLQHLVAALACELHMSERELGDLKLLARFHDIGKVGIPDSILFKPGKLTPDEAEEMKRHPEIGYRIAQAAPDFLPIADWILKHHEWWDGNGYPLGLRGTEIPVQSRIIAVADAFDAMTNDRPYRKAMPEEEAVAELERNAGTQFDPVLVEKFVALWKQNKTEAR